MGNIYKEMLLVLTISWSSWRLCQHCQMIWRPPCICSFVTLWLVWNSLTCPRSQAVWTWPFRGQLSLLCWSLISGHEFFEVFSSILLLFVVILNTRHKNASYLSYEYFYFIFSLFITVPSIILLLTVLLCGKKNL